MTNPPMPRREMFVPQAGGFDAEAWYVMDQRDNALIADEIMHGSGSSKFVYQFNLAGNNVTGISVIGARHLMSMYGGIKHRIVATTQKTGSLFTFTCYPSVEMPMTVSCNTVPELSAEPDFFQAVVELTDVKKGNTIQVEKRENRYELKRDGTSFERPHYAVIAQSKAFRNGLLSLIPQDVQLQWKMEMLRLDKSEVITTSVINEKRDAILRYSAAKAVSLNRRAVEALTMDQIAGLSDAAKEGKLTQFISAAETLGLLTINDQKPTESARASFVAVSAPSKREAAKSAAAPTAPTAPAEPSPEPFSVYQEGPALHVDGDAPTVAADTFGVEHFIVDESGEVVGERWSTNLAAAVKLVQMAAKSKAPQAIIENNADVIMDLKALGCAETLEILDRQRATFKDKAPPLDAEGPVVEFTQQELDRANLFLSDIKFATAAKLKKLKEHELVQKVIAARGQLAADFDNAFREREKVLSAAPTDNNPSGYR